MHTTPPSRLTVVVGGASLACALGAGPAALAGSANETTRESAPAVSLVAHASALPTSELSPAQGGEPGDENDANADGGPKKPGDEEGMSPSVDPPEDASATQSGQQPAEEQPAAGAPKPVTDQGGASSGGQPGADEAQGIVEKVFSGISSFFAGLFGG